MAGELDVDAMLRRISAKKFYRWEAFEEIEPFGGKRGDYHAALVSQTLANTRRDPKREAYTLRDFLLRFGEEEEIAPPTPKKQTSKDHERILDLFAKIAATPEKDL